jgi:Tol biopolymer transport system component
VAILGFDQSRHIVVGGSPGRRRLTVSSLRGDGPGRELLSAAVTAIAPQYSPNGQWVAYQGDEIGRPEIFIASIENPTTRYQVTTDGGLAPLWSPDGQSVIYRTASGFVQAQVSFTPRFGVAERASRADERRWAASSSRLDSTTHIAEHIGQMDIERLGRAGRVPSDDIAHDRIWRWSPSAN